MSERESWMPSAVRIQGAMAGGWPSVEREIRTAVERALAEEWKKNLDAKEELIRRFRELQAEQEARHKREVIEARIHELNLNGCRAETPTLRRLEDLRAELADLEEKP